MHKIVLMYSLVPESVAVYNLEVSSEELRLLRLCHGNYTNLAGYSDEIEEALMWLGEFIFDRHPVYKDFVTGDVEVRTPLNVDGELIVSGFMA